MPPTVDSQQGGNSVGKRKKETTSNFEKGIQRMVERSKEIATNKPPKAMQGASREGILLWCDSCPSCRIPERCVPRAFRAPWLGKHWCPLWKKKHAHTTDRFTCVQTFQTYCTFKIHKPIVPAKMYVFHMTTFEFIYMFEFSARVKWNLILVPDRKAWWLQDPGWAY